MSQFSCHASSRILIVQWDDVGSFKMSASVSARAHSSDHIAACYGVIYDRENQRKKKSTSICVIVSTGLSLPTRDTTSSKRLFKQRIKMCVHIGRDSNLYVSHSLMRKMPHESILFFFLCVVFFSRCSRCRRRRHRKRKTRSHNHRVFWCWCCCCYECFLNTMHGIK